MEDIKKQIEEIKLTLETWEHAYYVLDKPIVEDLVYDNKLKELKTLEEKYPEYITFDSPTQRVGGQVSEKFDKYNHKYPMLSLDNAFNQDDLYDFDKSIKKQLEKDNFSYFVEPKIDGLSISLIYEKGKFSKAVTRGNGVQGEDVTFNVKTIRSVPLRINDTSDYFEVRGEVFLSKKEFERINEERKLSNEDLFANPRNAAAGTIRQLNTTIVASRRLDVFLYYYLNRDKYTKHSESLSYIASLGFKVNDLGKHCKSIEDVIEHINYIENQRYNLQYEIDGAVVKVDEFKFYDKIGYTSKFPKWATAYKYPAEIKVTKLLNIFASVGRTGKITYNAILSPVSLAGTTVQAATLHNAEYIFNKKIKVGSNVKVKKAGDIIPEVLEVIEDELYNTLETYKKIEYCPACDSKLEIFNDEVDQYCINFNCERKIIKSLEHFVSRSAMNIDGMSIKIIEKLYANKIIKNVIDIYNFKKHKSKILELDNMGEKSFNNLLEAIEKSKTNDGDKLLFGLGIRYVGSKTAKLLLERFKDVKNLLNATKEEIESIYEVGPKVAQSIIDWSSIQENVDLINELQIVGVNINFSKNQSNDNVNISKKSFVITGTLSKPRPYFVDLIESFGGKVISAISKKTDYLLAGEEAGSKLEKAKSLQVNIISEEDFLEMLEG